MCVQAGLFQHDERLRRQTAPELLQNAVHGKIEVVRPFLSLFEGPAAR